MDKNQLLIVYICTGMYNNYYRGFYRSLKNLCPDRTKKVVLFTDHPEFYDDKEDPYCSDMIIPIRHNPWPIPTLLKFHYIREAMEKFDTKYVSHVAYFNANSRFLRKIPSLMVMTNKLVVTEHWGWTTWGGSSYESLMPEAIPNSLTMAYIDDLSHRYCNAGVVVAPLDVMEITTDWIIGAVNNDLKRGVIPPYHDESYLNKFVYDHHYLVTYLPSRFSYDLESMSQLEDEEKPYIGYAFSDIIQRNKYTINDPFNGSKPTAMTKAEVEALKRKMVYKASENIEESTDSNTSPTIDFTE